MEIYVEAERVLEGRELSFEPDKAFLTRVETQSYEYNSGILKVGAEITIYYISDIHIEYHLYSKKFSIKDIVDGLFSKELLSDIERKSNYVILFGGDTSSSIWINKEFMAMFMCKYRELGGAECRIFTVIGNHEYFGFSDIEGCLNVYNELYTPLGVALLDNSSYSINFGNVSIRVIGGIGFSGYNEIEFNPKNGTYKTLTRADEKIRTSLWEKSYSDLIRCSEGDEVCVCLTHYPIYDWLSGGYPGISYNMERECLLSKIKSLIEPNILYISGHTHYNIQYDTYYGDNQNGYYNKNIRFKRIVIR